MVKRAMKKTKILSCFVVIVILMSVVPVSVFAANNSINSTSNALNRSNEILLEKANSNFTPIFHTGINQTIDSKEIDSTNNIATVQGEVIPYKEKGEVLFRGEVYSNWYDSWGGVDWELKTVSIKRVLYDPNNYLQGKNSICVLKPEFSYPRMDWGSSDSLVEVYGQYVVGEKDGEIRYTEVRLCEPGEEWGSREYFVRDLTVGDTYKFTGTITYVSRNPSRAGIYSIDFLDDSGWDWYGEVYFSNTPNGPRIDNMAVGDKAEIRGSRHYYNAQQLDKASLIWICNPNNPTGTRIPRENIIDILQKAKGMVVVDECNYEYLGETVVDLIDKCKNLIISRSFSKNFGLAGLRLGFAISNSQNIKKLAAFGQYFRVNRMAEKAAGKALKYLDYYQEVWGKTKKVRDKFVWQINELGFSAYDSQANFVLVEFQNKKETERVWKYLKEKDIYALAGWENEFSGVPSIEYRARKKMQGASCKLIEMTG
jgi:hypothetical protein